MSRLEQRNQRGQVWLSLSPYWAISVSQIPGADTQGVNTSHYKGNNTKVDIWNNFLVFSCVQEC